ncbi:hypothetical protein GF324_01045 [bacterium]|nr:hypothetical protein [bacterium]
MDEQVVVLTDYFRDIVYQSPQFLFSIIPFEARTRRLLETIQDADKESVRELFLEYLNDLGFHYDSRLDDWTTDIAMDSREFIASPDNTGIEGNDLYFDFYWVPKLQWFDWIKEVDFKLKDEEFAAQEVVNYIFVFLYYWFLEPRDLEVRLQKVNA